MKMEEFLLFTAMVVIWIRFKWMMVVVREMRKDEFETDFDN